MSEFVFKEMNSQLAFQEHLHAIEDRLAQCERLQAMLQESAVHWCFYPVVRAIQALRGVQFTVAVGLIAETRRAVPLRFSTAGHGVAGDDAE